MRRLTEAGELASLAAQTPLLFVQFSAATCGPCAAISQKLDLWTAGRPMADSVCVPIEDFPALAAEQGVFTVPTVLVFVENKLALRESGYFSLEQLLARARRYLDLLSD